MELTFGSVLNQSLKFIFSPNQLDLEIAVMTVSFCLLRWCACKLTVLLSEISYSFGFVMFQIVQVVESPSFVEWVFPFHALSLYIVIWRPD